MRDVVAKSRVPDRVAVRVVLSASPPGVDFSLQSGRAANATAVNVQRGNGRDLTFDFELTVGAPRGGSPNFTGPFAQGTAAERFVYLCVGTCAGQAGSPWTRRIKVPLAAITAEQVATALASAGRLQATIPGTGKDGTPSCATVRLLNGWDVVDEDRSHARP